MRAQPSTYPNPLVRAREAAGLTQTELATRIHCSRAVIKWAEAGTYNNIPSSYYNEFPDLIDELHEYQQFRKHRRLDEFPNFQGCVVTNFTDFLHEVGMLPNTFAMKACVPHSEVFRALTQGKISTTIREFFLTIGAEFVGDN